MGGWKSITSMWPKPEPDWYAEWEELMRTAQVQQKPKAKPTDPIETAADDELIFELIKRGYAVAKMPADELAKVV
jgi:hypothetical protein